MPQRHHLSRSLASRGPVSRKHRRHPILTGLLQWGSTLSIAATLSLLPLGFHAELAQAYPRQTSVSVAQQEGDSYTALVRRAETAARTTAQQIFDGDILVSEVAITVVGESGTSIVPILTMRVSRDNWRTRPDPQQWSTYFRSARSLLELGTPAASPPSAPAAPVPSVPVNSPAAQPGTVPPANVIPPADASPTNQPTPQPANQPSDQPANQPANQPTNQPANQPTGQPPNQPANQPPTFNQPFNQPVNPSGNQPSNQPANPGVAPTPTPGTPTPPPAPSQTTAPNPAPIDSPATPAGQGG
jgi:hypothetical protein